MKKEREGGIMRMKLRNKLVRRVWGVRKGRM